MVIKTINFDAKEMTSDLAWNHPDIAAMQQWVWHTAGILTTYSG